MTYKEKLEKKKLSQCKNWFLLPVDEGVREWRQVKGKEKKFFTEFRDPSTASKKPVKHRIQNVFNIKEAKAFTAQLKLDLQNKRVTATKKPIVDDMAQAYLSTLNPKSKLIFEGIYDNNIKPSIGGMRLDKVKKRDIEEIVIELQRKGKSTSYIKQHRTVINGIYNQYDGEEELNPPTKFKTTKWENKEKKHTKLSKLTSVPFKDIAQCLYKKIMTLDTKWIHNPLEVKLVLLIVLQNARRINEVLQLQVKDFDLGASTLHIRPEYTKMNTEEIIPVSDEVIALVKQLKKKPTDAITEYQYNTFRYQFTPLLSSCANIDKEMLKGKALHQTRHLFTSILGREDGFGLAEADSMLSHSESESIMARYGIHMQFADVKRYFTHYWKILRG